MKPEAAQQQLKKFQLDPDLDSDDLDDDDVGETVVLTRAAKLPKSLRNTVYALYRRDTNGKPVENLGWDAGVAMERLAAKALDDLTAKERLKIFDGLLPSIAPHLEDGWQFLKSAPYQNGYERRGFRSPKDASATLANRWDWLSDMLSLANVYQQSAISPTWLAGWANYLHVGGYYYPGSAGNPLGRLFASMMSRPGKDGDSVFEVLSQSARNEHEIGGMGRHVSRGLLSASRPEGWELMEKMLLAAQRQEGLRQHILEVIDESHPEAFQRMLKLIAEHDLARFSAVARAVDVWFGLRWDSASTKVINQTINGISAFLEDGKAAAKGLTSSDPEQVFLALWCLAFRDAHASIDAAAKLLKHKQVEIRFIATRHLCEVQLPQAARYRVQAMQDDDIRVAYLAATETGPSEEEEDDTLNQVEGTFEALENLLPRLPEKSTKLQPLVWPWMELAVNRAQVASQMVDALGKRPPTKLIPYLKVLDVWDRRAAVQQLSEQKKWDQVTRDALFALAADAASDVREAVFEALQDKPLQSGEPEKLEALLTRKSSDVRRGALNVLSQQKAPQALASADRLLGAKEANQRVAGLELLRILKDARRSTEQCLAKATEFRTQRKKVSKEEESHLQEIEKQQSLAVDVSPANCLGLADLTAISPVVAPRKLNAPFFTKATYQCLKSLDDLIHQHRETVIRVKSWDGPKNMPLGAVEYEFPVPSRGRPIEKLKTQMPLLELWESWYANRSSDLRDKDGLEIHRATILAETIDDYDYDDLLMWCKKPENKTFANALTGGVPSPRYRYLELMMRILPWIEKLHPVDGLIDYLLDAAESTFAMVPSSAHQLLVPKPKDGKQKKRRGYYDDDEDEETDWRNEKAFEIFPNALQTHGHSIDWKVTRQQFERAWNLFHWRDRPVPGARRYQPGFDMLKSAYDQGCANFHDMAEVLIGPRVDHRYHSDSFDELEQFTARKLSKNNEAFLERHPELKELIDKAREIVLNMELTRGDTPTPVTNMAWSLGSLSGTDCLMKLLKSIGKAGFKTARYYEDDKKLGRQTTLTNLVQRTYPSDADTLEDFSRQVRESVAAGLFPETRILELAFLAPQWTRFIENYLGWEGFSEGLYWFLAHMTYADEAGENAAIAEDLDDDEVEDEDEDFDEDLDEDDDEASSRAEPQEKLSPWERLILERTPLTRDERFQGAVDIAWFQRTYAELKPAHWQALADAARFAATSAQAKKAQFLADVLLGKTKRQELIDGIRKKNLKDHVRLLGLLPLATGVKRDQDILERYHVLVNYRQYARGLSSMTREDAMRAAEIGFQNLARTAGYVDPIRLEWAMEADTVKDLAKGSISATKEGVTVTLQIDDHFQPELTICRGDKPLKTIPPAVKKDKAVAAITGRVADLKKQASRIKQSLEMAMCRSDKFTSAELIQLCQHAVLSPMLQRLVLSTDDGLLGYPEPNGKSLRDHSGKSTVIKKTAQLMIAHPYQLFKQGQWDKWQHDCFVAERLQPIKQIFRELYVVTKQEKANGTKSLRYAAQQVNPKQAYALWGRRGWQTQDGVWKVFHDLGIMAVVDFQTGFATPLEVEGLTIDAVFFRPRDTIKPIKLVDVPPNVFSEVMRDLDLVVSVAHRGEVDPEASASTVEMRTALLKETCSLLGLKNVKLKDQHALIQGDLGHYSVHLGSGTVHKMPGGALCIVPVHAQHRGRIFLPFADDDPRTAEVISKVLLLARDHEILDPGILDQLRNT